LTTEKENRKTKSRKRKTTVASKWRSKTKLLQNTGNIYRTFKRVTEIPERKIHSLVGPLVDQNVFLSSPSGKGWIFSKYIGLWEISVSKIRSLF
jgi:hypothetical protein